MNRTQQAQAINADLGGRWVRLDGEQRAQSVIDWCQEHQIDTSSILARPLHEAMRCQKFWCQGPDDYMDMVYSIAAFLRARA